MTLSYHPIPAFKDNYIWVISDGLSAIVIDPGDAGAVVAYCESRGLTVTALLLTHHHADHVAGASELLASNVAARHVEVYGPAREMMKVPWINHPVMARSQVWLAAPRFSATVLEVPGHTAGHVAYYQPAKSDAPPHLFCGDTLFATGCGRLLEGTAAQMLNSLDQLAALEDNTLVHCAHEYTLANLEFARICEPSNRVLADWQNIARQLRASSKPTVPTTIGHEKAVNPFLRCDKASILFALAEKFGVDMGDRLEAFTHLRAWKDVF